MFCVHPQILLLCCHLGKNVIPSASGTAGDERRGIWKRNNWFLSCFAALEM